MPNPEETRKEKGKLELYHLLAGIRQECLTLLQGITKHSKSKKFELINKTMESEEKIASQRNEIATLKTEFKKL